MRKKRDIVRITRTDKVWGKIMEGPAGRLRKKKKTKHLAVFPSKRSLTDSLADSCGWIHLIAVVAFTLVPSFQVDADLAADARV